MCSNHPFFWGHRFWCISQPHLRLSQSLQSQTRILSKNHLTTHSIETIESEQKKNTKPNSRAWPILPCMSSRFLKLVGKYSEQSNDVFIYRQYLALHLYAVWVFNGKYSNPMPPKVARGPSFLIHALNHKLKQKQFVSNHPSNGNFRIRKWRYCTIFLAIYSGDGPLHGSYIS